MFFDFRLVDRINILTLVAVDGELCGVCRRLLRNYRDLLLAAVPQCPTCQSVLVELFGSNLFIYPPAWK